MARIFFIAALGAVLMVPAASAGKATNTTTTPVGPAASVYVEQIPSASGRRAEGQNERSAAVADGGGGGGSIPVSLVLAAVAAAASVGGAFWVRAAKSRRRAA